MRIRKENPKGVDKILCKPAKPSELRNAIAAVMKKVANH